MRILKINRIKKLPCGSYGDYKNNKIRIQIRSEGHELPILMHEFTHAAFDIYKDYLKNNTTILDNPEREEVIAREIEGLIYGILEEYKK